MCYRLRDLFLRDCKSDHTCRSFEKELCTFSVTEMPSTQIVLRKSEMEAADKRLPASSFLWTKMHAESVRTANSCSYTVTRKSTLYLGSLKTLTSWSRQCSPSNLFYQIANSSQKGIWSRHALDASPRSLYLKSSSSRKFQRSLQWKWTFQCFYFIVLCRSFPCGSSQWHFPIIPCLWAKRLVDRVLNIVS